MSSISLKMIICPYWLIGPNKLNAHTTTNWSSNCLEFIDLKAQICIPDLSPNLLYHLPTLYHFLVDHLKNSHDPEHPEHTDLWNIPKYLPAGDKDNSNLHYLSPDHEHHSAKDGTPTITSNIRNLLIGIIFLCLLSTSFICYIYIFFGSNSVHMPLDLMDEMGTKQRIQLKIEEKRTKLKIDLDKLLLFKLFCFYDVTIRTMDVFHFVSPLIFPFINTLSSFMGILDFLYVSSCFRRMMSSCCWPPMI